MSESFTLVKGARLIDGLGGPPLERGAVLMQGTDIRAVGTEEAVAAPEGAPVEVLDYPNMTIMPGLIDAHVHLISLGDGRAGDDMNLLADEILTLQAAKNARAHLYSGVTSVRDCGAKNRTTFLLREAMEMGITVGPRLVLTGRPLAIVGGHLSYFGSPATGPTECRAAVRQLIKEGADFIKVTATGGSTRTSKRFHASFNLDELSAITDEVHKFGKHAVAHCASSDGLVNALDAGVDTIVHAIHADSDGTYRYRPELTERLIEQKIFVNPTLHAIRHQMWFLEAKLERGEALSDPEQADLDDLRYSYGNHEDFVGRMREAGVTMVAGSDSAWLNYKMGGFQHELEGMTTVGFSPLEVITSATSDSARSCRIDDVTGALVEGRRGDVIVIDGDPSADIAAMWNVAEVFQDGAKVDRGNFV
jgi:imidazolonepropionase-like amidohydrolase